MIEFATLLIGLVVGPRQVEIAVQGPVAAINVSLDGRLVQRLTEEPWVAAVDFGDRLIPHRLIDSSFEEGGSLGDLEEAAGRELSSQTIVWVKGEHLPTELSLSPGAPPGVALLR